MPAPKNNKFAKGHDGSDAGRKSAIDEKKITTLKNLCVDWAIKEMGKKSSKEKKDIVLKVIGLLPKEVTADVNGNIQIGWIE